MELRSDRHYLFPVAPDHLWAAWAETGDYRGWWPWLRTFDAVGLVPGDVWRCTVRPPLPYVLRFAIHLEDVVRPSLVTARISGDIAGGARLDVADHDGSSAVRLTSWLTPSNRAFEMIAKVARPVLRWGHDWVLDTGAKQFAARAIDRR